MNHSSSSQDKRGLRVLTPKNQFAFSCHAQLDCYTRCCRDITIFLTPYDILRMRKALGISSSEFLARYTFTMLADNGLPVVVLKMQADESKSCPFVTGAGCRIYADRPWACRIYPIQPESSKITEKAGKEYYSILQAPFCQGLRSGRTWGLKDWIESQGIGVYQQMEAVLKKITHHERMSGQKITNPQIQDMYYMTCYDMDRFRCFVLESSFLKRFDVNADQVEAIRDSDEALYRFALRWLEYGLLARTALDVNPEYMAARKQEMGIQ